MTILERAEGIRRKKRIHTRVGEIEKFNSCSGCVANTIVEEELSAHETRIAELEAERERLEGILWRVVIRYDKGDNGTCSVCRIGHRLYDLKGRIQICEWEQCLSHEWRQALTTQEADK